MQITGGLERSNIAHDDFGGDSPVVLLNLASHAGGVLGLGALGDEEDAVDRGVGAPACEVARRVDNELVVSVLHLVELHGGAVAHPQEDRVGASGGVGHLDCLLLRVRELKQVSDKEASGLSNARASGVVIVHVDPHLLRNGNSFC